MSGGYVVFRIRATAILMIVAGLLVLIGGSIAPALLAMDMVMNGMAVFDHIDPAKVPFAIAFVAVTGLVALMAGLVIVVGGYSMFHCRRRRLVMTAAILCVLAFAAFLFTGVFTVFGWLALPVGFETLRLLHREGGVYVTGTTSDR